MNRCDCCKLNPEQLEAGRERLKRAFPDLSDALMFTEVTVQFGSLRLCCWCRPALADELAEGKLQRMQAAHRRNLETLRDRITEEIEKYTFDEEDSRERETIPAPAEVTR